MKTILKYLPLIVIFLILLVFYGRIDASAWISSNDFHTSIGFGSSLLSIMAGVMILVYFFTTGYASYLVLSAGFVLIGSAEFFHSFFSFERIWPHLNPHLELALSATWLTGSLVLVFSFFLALMLSRREISSSNRLRYAVLFNSGGFIFAVIISIITFESQLLPYSLRIGSEGKKIAELSMSVLFLAALILYIRHYRNLLPESPFFRTLTAFLAFRALAHFYLLDAHALYDAHWDIAHAIVFLSSVFPILGMWFETLVVHKASSRYVDDLKKEVIEHKLAVKALSEREEDFRRMFENNSAAMIMIEDNLIISMVNDKFCALTGIGRQEAAGMDGSRYIPGRFMDRYMKYGFDTLVKEGDVPDIYELTIYKNGSELKHVYSTLSVLNDKKIIISFTDITERKIAEEELIKSEERFKHIFSTIREVIYSVDIATREYRYLSPSFEKITGYSIEDIARTGGRQEFLKKVVNIREFAEWEEFMVSLDETNKHRDFNYETQWICKDGTIKYLNDHWFPVFKNGILEATQGVLTDITERKLAELSLTKYSSELSKLNHFALRLSRLTADNQFEDFIVRQVREISDAALATFSVFDPASHTLTTTKREVNPAYAQKVSHLAAHHQGFDRFFISEAICRKLKKDLIVTFNDFRELNSGNEPAAEDLEIRNLLHSDRFILLAYVMEGELYGASLLLFSASQTDPFSELLLNFSHLASESLNRNKIEGALKESEKKYRSLITNIPGAVFHRRLKSQRRLGQFHQRKDLEFDNNQFLDFMKDISLEYFSERVEEVTGYRSKDFMDKRINIHDLIHPDDRRQTFEQILKALTENNEFELEYRIKHRDGSWHWILERFMSYPDGAGDSLEIDGILYDTTDRKQIEIELVDYAYANQELKQFAYIASHQLQEPIRTVSNYTKIIEEDYSGRLDEGGVIFLHTIRDATNRMAVLINTLLEFSQIGRNRKLASVDFINLLDSVITDLTVLIKNSEAIIEISEMPVLKCYEVEIRQLFHNLIINAIKFQTKDQKPVIKIRSEKLDNKWKFSVSDNGIGIDSKYFEKIFDIFQRLHLNEEVYEGKGIGLAYCKKIVQLHHGEIWVESVVGSSTTFYFTIPVEYENPGN